MPITLKKDVWKVKDPSSGTYRGAAIFSTTLPEDAAKIIQDTEIALDNQQARVDTITANSQAAITTASENAQEIIDDNAAQAQIAINNAAANAQARVDTTVADVQTSVNEVISNAQTAVNNLDSQRQTMMESIASVAGQGTDTTFTQPGVAADAKEVGNLKNTLDSYYDHLLFKNPQASGTYNGINYIFDGTRVTFNGTATNNAMFSFSNTGKVYMSSGFSSDFFNTLLPQTDKFSFPLPVGHRVRTEIRYISGNVQKGTTVYDVNNIPTWSAHVVNYFYTKMGATYSDRDYPNGTNYVYGSRTMKIVSDKTIATFSIYIYAGITCNNLVIDFTAVDIDDPNYTVIQSLNKDFNSSIIPYFNASKKYLHGDYMQYGGEFYYCTNEDGSIGEFNPDNWCSVVLSQAVANNIDKAYPLSSFTDMLFHEPTQDIFQPARDDPNISQSTKNVNDRYIWLEKNRVRQRIKLTNPTGSTLYGFVISSKPRFLGTGKIDSQISRLTEEDFIDFTIRPVYHLTATIDNIIYKDTSNSAVGEIVFVTMNYETNEKQYTSIAIYKLGTRKINVCDYLPDIEKNGNIAVLFISYFPNRNLDVTINLNYDYEFKKFKDYTTLPNYWIQECNEKIQKIRQDASNIPYGIGKQICFITDCHWNNPNNPHRSPAVIKKITDACNIDYLVNGGDTIFEANLNGKEAAMSELFDFINLCRTNNIRLPMIMCRGNHDNNQDGATPTNPPRFYRVANGIEYKDGTTVPSDLRASEKAKYLVLRLELSNIIDRAWINEYDTTPLWDNNNIRTSPDGYYWEDDTYRYATIYWYSSSTLVVSWASELFNTTKPVVIFNHGLYIRIRNRDKSSDILQEQWILNNFEPYKNQIRCIIQGHAHTDGLRLAYNGLVPIICIDCDQFKGGLEGGAGTSSEQSFAVITLGKDDIKVTKVGRGANFVVERGSKEFYTLLPTEIMYSCYDVKTITPNSASCIIEDAADANIQSMTITFSPFIPGTQDIDARVPSTGFKKLSFTHYQDSNNNSGVTYETSFDSVPVAVAGGELNIVTGELKVTHIVKSNTSNIEIETLSEPSIYQLEPITLRFYEDYNRIITDGICTNENISNIQYGACEIRYNPVEFF